MAQFLDSRKKGEVTEEDGEIDIMTKQMQKFSEILAKVDLVTDWKLADKTTLNLNLIH